ncbi:MAG TPA: hypothetical protein VGG27_19390 [Magnetospirillaceae bacterium]|jgi:hypothetical protein
MNRKILLAAAFSTACLSATSAWAHAVCGNRVFPATLTMDDPGVGDELSLPTVQYARIPPSAGGGETTTYGYEWDKTITEHFGFAINGDYVTQSSGGVKDNGWDNVTLTLKDEVLCSQANEFMASIGIAREFAKTGSPQLLRDGVIDTVGNTAPTVYFGKGLGDLPIGWARAFGITSEVDYAFSDSPNASPNELDYNFSLQYSIPYLQQHVKDLGLPDFVGHLTPLVEVTMSSPNGQPTTGTIAPGVLYDADTWQFGIEATIPANSATWQSQGFGFIAQFHLFLDDILPNSLGKPLFGGRET